MLVARLDLCDSTSVFPALAGKADLDQSACGVHSSLAGCSRCKASWTLTCPTSRTLRSRLAACFAARCCAACAVWMQGKLHRLGLPGLEGPARSTLKPGEEEREPRLLRGSAGLAAGSARFQGQELHQETMAARVSKPAHPTEAEAASAVSCLTKFLALNWSVTAFRSNALSCRWFSVSINA